MITPNDIATKDFKKVAVGYSPEEVDTFLDDIYEDYEKLYKESQKEKSKTEAVAEDTDRLKHLEKSIERTLSLAEAAAEETKAAAKADGDAIINSAKQQAEDILASARTKAYELEQKISGLESRYELMKTRIKLLLYAEIELLDKGEPLPFPIEGAAIYYVGPTPERPGCAIGAAGPTTSGRMDAYTPRLLDLGLACMIGKGKRTDAVKQSVVKNGAVYLAAIGGAGALMAGSVQSCEIIAWPDLGCEAVRKLVVKDFPLTVLLDTHGGDLYRSGPAAYLASREHNA